MTYERTRAYGQAAVFKMGAHMRKKAEILADINAGIPPGVDWLAGAKRYVEAVFERNDRAAIEKYALTKPFYTLPPYGFERGLEEAVVYQYNFTNALQLLQLPGGARERN